MYANFYANIYANFDFFGPNLPKKEFKVGNS